MTDQVLTGVVTLAAGTKFGSTDVNPTEREGYIHLIDRFSFSMSGDDTGNAGLKIVVGGSIALPAPTSFDETDAFLPGVNFLEYPVYVLANPVLVDSQSIGPAGHVQGRFYHEDMHVVDSLRLFAASQVSVDAGKSIIINWRLKLIELKVTQTVQQSILSRVYG